MHILDEGKYVQLYMYCTTGRILLDLVVAAWLVHVADHGWLARMHICSHVRTTCSRMAVAAWLLVHVGL